jgi:hypothetical protein
MTHTQCLQHWDLDLRILHQRNLLFITIIHVSIYLFIHLFTICTLRSYKVPNPKSRVDNYQGDLGLTFLKLTTLLTDWLWRLGTIGKISLSFHRSPWKPYSGPVPRQGVPAPQFTSFSCHSLSKLRSNLTQKEFPMMQDFPAPI